MDVRIFVGAELDPCAGCWLDPADFSSEAEVFAHVAEASPEWAKLVQYDPEAESCGGDWCIADYEGIELGTIAEYLEFVSALAELSDDEQEAFAAFVDNGSGETAQDFRDAYQGTFGDVGEWAEDFEDSCGGLSEIPERLRAYIDFDKLGRDAEYSGDIWTADLSNGTIAVFWNH